MTAREDLRFGPRRTFAASARHFLFTRPGRGEPALDKWSLLHLVTAVGMAVVGTPWAWGLGLIVGFEALEAGFRRVKTNGGRGLFENESWPNVYADILIGCLAFGAAKVWLPSLGWLAFLPGP